jgi:hypothetical protein
MSAANAAAVPCTPTTPHPAHHMTYFLILLLLHKLLVLFEPPLVITYFMDNQHHQLVPVKGHSIHSCEVHGNTVNAP